MFPNDRTTKNEIKIKEKKKGFRIEIKCVGEK